MDLNPVTIITGIGLVLELIAFISGVIKVAGNTENSSMTLGHWLVYGSLFLGCITLLFFGISLDPGILSNP